MVVVEHKDDALIFRYQGLDGIRRITCFTLHGVRFEVEGDLIRFRLVVPARASSALHSEISFHEEREAVPGIGYRFTNARPN